MEMIGLTDAFDCGDLVIPMHDGEGEARVDAATVDVDRACSALTVITAFFRAGQGKVLAEAVEQGSTRVKSERVGLSVDLEIEGYRALSYGYFRRG
jgi:hypothetical protein